MPMFKMGDTARRIVHGPWRKMTFNRDYAVVSVRRNHLGAELIRVRNDNGVLEYYTSTGFEKLNVSQPRVIDKIVASSEDPVAVFDRMHAMHKQGKPIGRIARMFGLTKAEVEGYLFGDGQ